MKKIMTAINNPKLNQQLKELNQYEIVAPDIQYQEGIFEILEKEKDIQFLILSEILYGKNNLKELIEKIQKINFKIKIIVILEKENQEKIKYLNEKNINAIFYHNQFTIKEIINVIEKENIATKNIEEEIEAIKNLILENKIMPKEDPNTIKKLFSRLIEKFQQKSKIKLQTKTPNIITIAGNSGVGKSIVSSCLAININQEKRKNFINRFRYIK